jgi:hypothetical protein
VSDPIWISIIGATTGIIGAITGIAGAIMGYISYQRTEELKSLDLRIELKRAETDIQLIVNELPSQIEFAKRSRQAVLSATGQLRSGIATQLESQWENDLAEAQKMVEKLPISETDYSSFSQNELEKMLVQVHKETRQATLLKEKYDAEVAKDDKERDRIRAQHDGRA